MKKSKRTGALSQKTEPQLTGENGHLSKSTFSQSGYMEIEFSGSAKEFFGIWIVNVILSIITIGIYSAWAKVRRETYFKNNTKILNTGFGYHATGMQILKGRIIVVLGLLFINLVTAFFPLISIATVIAVIFLLPWILNNSLRFSARMTSYRNVHFNWNGTYWKTFWFFVIAPIFSAVSVGLLMPLISKAYYKYFAKSYSYGTTEFSCEPKVKDYYFAFGLGVVLPSILLPFAVAILSIITPINIPNLIAEYILGEFIFGATIDGIILALPIAILIGSVFASFVYPVLCRNLMMKSLMLSNVAKFDSKIWPIKYVWINFSNVVVIILSLSLMLPWAKVRLYKYLASCSEIAINGDLQGFVDEANKNKSSFGEELAEIEGFEVTI